MDIETLVDGALARRRELLDLPDHDTVRLFHGEPDGLAGLVIERFGDVLIVQLHEGRLKAPAGDVQQIASCFMQRIGAKAVYRKHHVRDRATPDPTIEREHHDATPWLGTSVNEEVDARESGITYRIRPYDGYSVGLFLDHRENRRRVRAMAPGRRVLNLFSYTCGFSLAAAVGGAASVSSVDLSKRYLEWGKRNFTANGLPLDGHWFFCSDALDFFKRAARQGRRYDLIVIDPPTFGRSGKGGKVFVLDELLERLGAGAVSLLDPGGHLLLACNHRRLNHDDLEGALQAGAASRKVHVLERPPLPADFPGDLDYAKTIIARVD